MLTFGKYKGKSLLNVIKEDYSYFNWMIKNIEDIESKFDNEDKTTLFKFTKPLEYLNEKHPNLWKMDVSIIICTLKKEGILDYFDHYVHDDVLNYSIDSVFGSYFGSLTNFNGWYDSNDARNVLKDYFIRLQRIFS